MPSEDKFGKDRFNDLKAADALNRLSERSNGSRLSLVIIAVVGLFVLAFVVGLVFKSVSGGVDNAPDIPKVELG